MPRQLMVAALALLAAHPALAATHARASPRSALFERCMKTGDAAHGVTVAMHDCLAGEWERQDNALNGAYRMRVAALSPARRGALRGSERAWIKQRDAACASAGSAFQGGSMEPLAVDECSIDMTILRTARVKRFR